MDEIEETAVCFIFVVMCAVYCAAATTAAVEMKQQIDRNRLSLTNRPQMSVIPGLPGRISYHKFLEWSPYCKVMLGFSSNCFAYILDKLTPVIRGLCRDGTAKKMDTKEYKIPHEERILLFLLGLRNFSGVYGRALHWNWSKTCKSGCALPN